MSMISEKEQTKANTDGLCIQSVSFEQSTDLPNHKDFIRFDKTANVLSYNFGETKEILHLKKAKNIEDLISKIGAINVALNDRKRLEKEKVEAFQKDTSDLRAESKSLSESIATLRHQKSMIDDEITITRSKTFDTYEIQKTSHLEAIQNALTHISQAVRHDEIKTQQQLKEEHILLDKQKKKDTIKFHNKLVKLSEKYLDLKFSPKEKTYYKKLKQRQFLLKALEREGKLPKRRNKTHRKLLFDHEWLHYNTEAEWHDKLSVFRDNTFSFGYSMKPKTPKHLRTKKERTKLLNLFSKEQITETQDIISNTFEDNPQINGSEYSYWRLKLAFDGDPILNIYQLKKSKTYEVDEIQYTGTPLIIEKIAGWWVIAPRLRELI